MVRLSARNRKSSLPCSASRAIAAALVTLAPISASASGCRHPATWPPVDVAYRPIRICRMALLRRLPMHPPVLDPAQAQILAQGLALVLRPESAPPLQLRHHRVEELGQAARMIWGHDVEPVAGVVVDPIKHLVG